MVHRVVSKLTGLYSKVDIFATALLAVLYFFAGKLGLKLAFVNPSATAVWPPTGIAIAALVLLGYRFWPGILLGAFAVNLTTSGSVVASLGIAIGNTLEGLVAAFLVLTFAGGRSAFERPQNVFKFAFLAAVASTAISATVGVTTLGLTGYARWSDFRPIWLTWWLGDMGGALIVAPLLILWSTRSPGSWNRSRALEGVLLFLALVVVGLAVFGNLLPWSAKHYPVEFLTVPVTIWVAFRFGPREAAMVIFLLSGIADWGTLHGFGPFAVTTPNESLLLLHAFLVVTAVTTLVLAAAILDGRRADVAEATRDQWREFLGMVVHDLRSPLTVAVGYTQLAQRQLAVADYDATKRTLARMESSLQTMRRLVNDLLDSARIGGGRFVISPRPMDLAELVAKAVGEQQAADAGHHFVVETPDHLTGNWDADRLGQVLANLLSNAVKYSPAGTDVRVRAELNDGRVLLAVADQGLGFAPAQMEQLFQPFSRLGRERQATGTGLGLYITKGIVEAHGGRIWVDSELGQGSMFFVELPITRQTPSR
jgi:signal transduction histidine kinase